MLILSIPTIIGSGAVSVDLSYQKVARTELQAVADIAAMAGTDKLDGTDQGVVDARDSAMRAAHRNSVAGQLVSLSDKDLQLGAWDTRVGQLDPNATSDLVDSVQVRANRDDLRASFAELVYKNGRLAVSGASTGFNPDDDAPSQVGCYLPIAIPSCLFDRYTEYELNTMTLTVNSDRVDNAGWGRVGDLPNANWSRDQLWNCEQDGIISVDDEVGLQNGVVASALKEVGNVIKVSETSWDSDRWGPIPERMAGSELSASDYGRTLEGAIIVFQADESFCKCQELDEDEGDHDERHSGHDDDGDGEDDDNEYSYSYQHSCHGHAEHHFEGWEDAPSTLCRDEHHDGDDDDDEEHGHSHGSSDDDRFNGYHPLVGFVWGAIYDVRSRGSASDKDMKIKLDTVVARDIGLRGGGGFDLGITHKTNAVLIK